MKNLSLQICQVEAHNQEQESIRYLSCWHDYKSQDWGVMVVKGKQQQQQQLSSWKLVSGLSGHL